MREWTSGEVKYWVGSGCEACGYKYMWAGMRVCA